MKQDCFSLEQYFEEASLEIAKILQENTKNVKDKIALQVTKLKIYSTEILETKKAELEYERMKLALQRDFLCYFSLAIFVLLLINKLLTVAIAISIFIGIYLAIYWFLVKRLILKISIIKKAIASKTSRNS